MNLHDMLLQQWIANPLPIFGVALSLVFVGLLVFAFLTAPLALRPQRIFHTAARHCHVRSRILRLLGRK